jgi:hypothetical protein
MKNLYSGPRPDLKSVISLNPHKSEPVILVSKKPVVVVLTVSLTEDNEHGDGDIEELFTNLMPFSKQRNFRKQNAIPIKLQSKLGFLNLEI